MMDAAPIGPTPPTRSDTSLDPAWTRSVQVTVCVLLLGGVLFTLGRSFRQSLQAGSGTVPDHRVDLNAASIIELMSVPGIGTQLAQRIVKDRTEEGFFQRIEDLRRIKGVGAATIERVRPNVFVSYRTPSARPSPVPAEKPYFPAAKPKKAALTEPIDINSASAEELRQIPGIGPMLSQRIVETRHQQPFQTVDELRRVRGIGPKTLEKARPLVIARPVPASAPVQ
jgi:competence protein ComEA